MKTLYTRWGKELDPEHVLSEYPRPMMRRKSYVNLNGYWDYRICKEMKRRPPASYEGQILVPFSPESPLSGVNRRLGPKETLWYHRTFIINPLSVTDILFYESQEYLQLHL